MPRRHSRYRARTLKWKRQTTSRVRAADGLAGFGRHYWTDFIVASCIALVQHHQNVASRSNKTRPRLFRPLKFLLTLVHRHGDGEFRLCRAIFMDESWPKHCIYGILTGDFSRYDAEKIVYCILFVLEIFKLYLTTWEYIWIEELEC